MAININNLNNGNTQVSKKVEQQTQLRQQTSEQQVKSESAKTAQQDSVSLTPQAKQFSELQKKAKESPVIDQKRIDQLKKAISSGEYKVDADKLAKNIINFEFNLP